MRKTVFTLLVSILLSGCATPQTSLQSTNPAEGICEVTHPDPAVPAGDVLALMQKERPEEYEWSQSVEAKIIPLDDNRSYAVWWEPENFNPETDTVLVSLHGHGEWAVKDFEIWYPEIVERGYAILAVQWWFGRSLESEGYYEPDQIDAIIEEALASKNIPADSVIFQGFSMGGARSYAVTLYDQWCGSNYFGVSIANAGQWEDNYKPYASVLAGDYGEAPFDDTHWILFCGEEDLNEYAQPGTNANVCDGMEHTRGVLTEWGGVVDLLIQDPTGDHGSFMLNAENQTQALDEAETILRELGQNEQAPA